jgi:hypothetical protein
VAPDQDDGTFIHCCDSITPTLSGVAASVSPGTSHSTESKPANECNHLVTATNGVEMVIKPDHRTISGRLNVTRWTSLHRDQAGHRPLWH